MLKHPEGFIQNLTVALKERELIPMWGDVPPFPWKELENSLKQILQCEHLTLSPQSSDWKEFGDFFKGLGEDPLIISCALTPLNPPFFLAFPHDDVATLTSSLLDQKDAKKTFTDPDYLNGFFRFVILKLLSHFNNLKPLTDLSVKMNDIGLKSEIAYCIDVAVTHPQRALHARAIFPKTFHKVVSSHFMGRPLSEKILHESQLTVSLSLTCAHVNLSIGIWEKISVGDFIILDTCTYSPLKKSGTLKLNLSHQGLFLVRLKNHQIKIIDYTLYEEDLSMNETPDNEDEDLIPEDNDFEEDFETSLSEEEEPSFNEEQNLSEKLLSAQDIPLDVVVEVSRIKMSLKDLLKLKPGNTLEVSANPETSVTLTVSGKPIGRGQLVQIGDTVGVKMTELP